MVVVGWGTDLSYIDEQEAVRLLDVVQLAVMNANSANARAVKSNLGATLRRVCADAPAAIAPFADAVLLAGDFLSDLAWADSVDQALLDRQRDNFAGAMDHLIREAGRMRVKAVAKNVEADRQGASARSYNHMVLARTKLAVAVKRWAGKSGRYGRSLMPARREPLASPPMRQDPMP